MEFPPPFFLVYSSSFFVTSCLLYELEQQPLSNSCLFCSALPATSHLSQQESSLADQFAMKAMSDLFDMLEGSFKPTAASTDNSDLLWTSNFDEAVAKRGKAREAAAKQRLQEAEQAEKDLLEAVQDEFEEEAQAGIDE